MNIFSRIFKSQNGLQKYSLKTTREEREDFSSSIISSSAPSSGFYLLLVLATFIVVIGLVKDNLVLLIGGMLVAPLLSPILSISLGITILNFKVISRSVLVFIVSALVTLVVAAVIGLGIDFSLSDLGVVTLMANFSWSTFLIPVAAGAAASFTWAKKDLTGSLSGVAITVTLMPPLAAMGLALASRELYVFKNALAVYGLNVSGIIIGSLVIFLVLGFYKSSKAVIQEVEKEENN